LKKHPFRHILLRNLAICLFPVILLMMALALFTGHLLGKPDWRVIDADQVEAAELIYGEGEKNIRLNIDELIPSGVVYKAGEKEVGTYFYMLKEQRVYLFLIRKRNGSAPDAYPKDLKAHLTKDEKTVQLIQHTYADALGIPESEMDDFFSPIILDEVHYPGKAIHVLAGIRRISQVIGFALLGYLILAAFFPGLNLLCHKYDDLPEYDRELSEKLLFYNGKIAITENYLFRLKFPLAKIILLDDIKYLSLKEDGHLLTASNEEKLYVEMRFDHKKEAKMASDLIRGVGREENEESVDSDE